MNWQPPKLAPLDIKPHPYCGCEYCVETFYPNGSPRHDRSGNPIPPVASSAHYVVDSDSIKPAESSDTEDGQIVERTT